MRTVDLDDEQSMPTFAAVSYTWGNPITIYESPLPDLRQLNFRDHAAQLPFVYRAPDPLGPGGARCFVTDPARLQYYKDHPHVPREEVCWDKGTSRTIQVDGCPVSVHENLFLCLEALLRLRTERFAEPLPDNVPERWLYPALRHPVWVDALGINQEDLAERAAQVQLMGRIFKSAHTVFGWAGEAGQLAGKAVQAVGLVLDFDATRSHLQGFSNPELQEVSLSSVPGMTVVHWFALFALFQRFWFRRAWIAQEVIFANHVLVLLGEAILSLDFLLAVCAFLETTGLDHDLIRLGRNFLTGGPVSDLTQQWEKLATFRTQTPSPNPGLRVDPRDAVSFLLGCHHVRARLGLRDAAIMVRKYDESTIDGSLSTTRHSLEFHAFQLFHDYETESVVDTELGIPGYRFHRKPLPMLAVISQFRSLDATDPRDKIFAFLSLAEDELGLVPDYSSDVRTVFRKAAEAMMRKTRRLSVLSHVQDPSETRIEALPSWVPDFSARLGRTPLDQGGYDDRFGAGTDDDCEELTSISLLNGTLTVRATRIGKVATWTDLDGDAVIQAMKLALKGPAKYPVEPLTWRCGPRGRYRSITSASRVEALWRTLIADDVGYQYGMELQNPLGEGFAIWILTDILEARDLLVEDHSNITIGDDQIAEGILDLIYSSFRTRLALWSALYDGRQILGELDIPDLMAVLDDLRSKREQEMENFNALKNIAPPDIPCPNEFSDFLPTARHLQKSFRDPPDPRNDEDPIAGMYKTASMRRLTPVNRRKLRNFEKMMKKASEGRKLFLTESDLFGLGPKSVGQDAQCEDEIWVLAGARVPFILRWVKGRQYRIVGEAYVHGAMYGEMTFSYDYDDYGAGDFLNTIRLV